MIFASRRTLRTRPGKQHPSCDRLVTHRVTDATHFFRYNLEITVTTRPYTTDEYDLSVLDRRLTDEENMHAESDRHGKNVVKPSGPLPAAKM